MVLLLTGAIDLRDHKVPTTKVADLKERLTQYLFSIEYAIDHYRLISDIVFCENTHYSYDYSVLQDKAVKNGKQLEILSFKGDYLNIQKKGKGYGEGESIAYALNHSQLLQNCDGFYKLTGRLVIKNMDQLVSSTKADNRFIFHPKNIYQRQVDHVETFFYKVSKEFYIQTLLNTYQEVDEKHFRYLEHIFYNKLAGLRLRAFKYPVQISGLSGTSGEPYLAEKKAIWMEKINCFLGVHHLQKTTAEKITTQLFAYLLRIRKTIKRFNPKKNR